MKLITKPKNASPSNHVANSMIEFKYDSEEEITVEACYRRFEEVFNKNIKTRQME